MLKSKVRSEAPKLAVSVREAVGLSGLSRSFLYQAMASGGLKYLKVGKRRLIYPREVERWLRQFDRRD